MPEPAPPRLPQDHVDRLIAWQAEARIGKATYKSFFKGRLVATIEITVDDNLIEGGPASD